MRYCRSREFDSCGGSAFSGLVDLSYLSIYIVLVNYVLPMG